MSSRSTFSVSTFVLVICWEFGAPQTSMRKGQEVSIRYYLIYSI